MANENLQKIMQEEWLKVRKSFYYPQLPSPRLDGNIPNGCLNFKNLQISISPNYIKNLKEKGCNENTSLNFILGHEIGHFVDYPGSVLNLLRLHKIARESLDEKQAFGLREAFLNIQNNTNLVQNRGYEANVCVWAKSEANEMQGLNKIYLGLYQELWKRDLDVKLKRNEKKLVKQLQEIDYLNQNRQDQNFREFIELVRQYQTQEGEGKGEGKKDKGQGKQGEGQGFGQGESSLEAFSDNQIREGIRQFAQESKPGEFEQTVEEILRELKGGEKGKGKGIEQKLRGLGAGTERGNLIIARNFYSALAENFSIPIRHKKIQKNGSLYPHSHEEFSMNDSVNDLDAFSSPGIIPGVTQKWIRKEGESIEDYFGIPDSLVVLDSSGSMPNPDAAVSIPVLGATVIANAYLNNNAKVTAYNFSADNIIVGPSKNKERLHETLRTYQGGGTVFNTDTIENIVKKQNNIDISIISDMKIHNLGDFLDYTSKLPNVHRVHLFYTNSGNIYSIADELKNKENIGILPLHSQEDIKKIVMGELKKSIK